MHVDHSLISHLKDSLVLGCALCPLTPIGPLQPPLHASREEDAVPREEDAVPRNEATTKL